MQHRLAHARQILLRQREDRGHRTDLREDGQRILIIGMNDVARVNLAEADAAIERRGDGGVGELRLRVFDGTLVGVDSGF